MAFKAKHWKVRYDEFDEALGLVFKELRFRQCFNNNLSTAEHVFELMAKDDDGRLIDRIPSDLQEIGSKPFTFEISDLKEEEKITHRHFISDYILDTKFSSVNRAKLTIISQEYPMLMDLSRSNEVFVAGGILENVVLSIAGRYGITLDVVEPSSPVPEFVTITKSGYTDYEFITDYICNRMYNGNNGGYIFFTTDGIKGMLMTPGYNAQEAYLPPEQLLNMSEPARGHSISKSGGLAIVSFGLNPYTKSHTSAISSAFPTELGNSEMWLAGFDRRIYPHSSQGAITAHTNAVYTREELQKYAFSFNVHGSSMIEDKKLEAPLIINLSSANVREPKEQRGILWELHHSIRRSTYTIKVICVRHQITV